MNEGKIERRVKRGKRHSGKKEKQKSKKEER
jgi:hypothetical protein